MNPLSSHAVLIGVNQYAHAEVGNLEGCANDVRVWVSLLHSLDVPSADTTALTSTADGVMPAAAFTASDKADLTVGGATTAEIRQAVTTLLDHLDGHPERQGILFFAGHGARGSDGGLRLCGSDVDPADVDSTSFAIAEIADLLKTRTVTLTIVLDTCFAGEAAAVGMTHRTITAGGGALTMPELDDDKVVLLMSSKPGESAYEYDFRTNMALPGPTHGVFTWALISGLERWRTTTVSVDEHTYTYYPVSFDQIAEVAAGVTQALKFPQTAWAAGGRRLRQLPALATNFDALPADARQQVREAETREPWLPAPREISGDWVGFITPSTIDGGNQVKYNGFRLTVKFYENGRWQGVVYTFLWDGDATTTFNPAFKNYTSVQATYWASPPAGTYDHFVLAIADGTGTQRGLVIGSASQVMWLWRTDGEYTPWASAFQLETNGLDKSWGRFSGKQYSSGKDFDTASWSTSTTMVPSGSWGIGSSPSFTSSTAIGALSGSTASGAISQSSTQIVWWRNQTANYTVGDTLYFNNAVNVAGKQLFYATDD